MAVACTCIGVVDGDNVIAGSVQAKAVMSACIALHSAYIAHTMHVCTGQWPRTACACRNKVVSRWRNNTQRVDVWNSVSWDVYVDNNFCSSHAEKGHRPEACLDYIRTKYVLCMQPNNGAVPLHDKIM